MTSPARRHFERVSAAQAAADAGEAPMQGEAFELMQAALFEDYRLLKSTQSMERKAEIKREILPKYADYITGVLEAGQGAQDDVLMRVMLWRIDAGDLAGAIAIAKYAIKHGLTPPDQFERGTAAIIAEEVADQALKLLDDDNTNTTELLAQLEEVEQLTGDADMHDQIRAKLHKALGYAQRANAQLEAAQTNLERALSLNDRIGVKKDLERLEREIKQNAAAKPTG
ncbi:MULTISPECIES: phage terminase small subunit [Halomonadaceae]|uniref:phage terminase small subunit n=1 Tax=Halomonadaceae TaxID=28256 RepID=UPI0012EEE2F1|nr:MULTISPECIES: phage terminase small subunit [Halomonas]CAD5269900.1 Phage small terminase subunit [Halomonas sp. 156]CAD5280789.1 Phage small terminase subunit [Halomonas sp. 113]CAD5282286.1 Phage small terminase subunit [Halomonas sp. 59]CAD5288391.1 Phage small terminase subunit [Halomonas sp. I3]VXB13829.1 Phage small terminase subunit [Halomonas titanicae]